MAQPPMLHDYYYGNEAEQYTFYRLPKVLFTDNRYKTLSDGAKILYGLMLDRMGLSIKNGWLDEENRVYIFFTLEDSQEYMNCGHNKGVKLMAELDTIGLVERVKQGQGKPARAYVKKFIANDGECYHKKKTDGFQQNFPQGNQDFPKAEIQTSEKGKSRLPHNGSADFRKSEPNKNYKSNTDFNKNNQSDTDYPIQSYPAGKSYPASQNGVDGNGLDERNAYRDMIKENVEYDCLCEQYGKERMDEIVELLTDTVCSKREYITIASDDYPAEVVKSRLLKVHQFHVEYVLDCMKKNTSKVRNIKKYLLAALYNAPATMDSYYSAEVNHDFYGGDF